MRQLEKRMIMGYDLSLTFGKEDILNTILTFYDIIEPSVPSQLSGIPLALLRKAIATLSKSNRAQLITIADGEGVRFLTAQSGK